MTEPGPVHPDRDPARGADLTARRDEQLLVERVRAGDPLAFEAIFRRYNRDLCAVAGRVVRSIAAAEDVVQDVFLAVWAGRERWQVTVSLQAYLRRAVRNMALRHASRADVQRCGPLPDASPPFPLSATRRGGQGVRPTLVDPGPSPEQQLEAATTAEEVARITATLPPRVREVYGLSRGEGLTHREIATRLGISPKTVELHLTRALAALRSALVRG